MPTIMTHGIIGLGAGKFFSLNRQPARFWVFSIVLPMLPDADVITFFYNIPYDHVMGHRGFSHSFGFAGLLGFGTSLLFFTRENIFPWRWWVYGLYFSLIIATHGVFDAMTNGGMGIAFFAPFDDARYFLPWRPLRVSPIGIAEFISEDGLKVALNELKWIWLPLGMVIGAQSLLKKFR